MVKPGGRVLGVPLYVCRAPCSRECVTHQAVGSPVSSRLAEQSAQMGAGSSLLRRPWYAFGFATSTGQGACP